MTTQAEEVRVVTTVGLHPIPWVFHDHELLKLWIWRTHHFEVKVTADQACFSWEIYDLVATHDGDPRFFTDGRCPSFSEAELSVREMIGKSYPGRYGYRDYAGSMATTFTIGTGERIDFATFEGQRVVVTVRLPTGQTQTVHGHLSVFHHEIHVAPDAGPKIRVQPPYICRVVGEGGASAPSTPVRVGLGRIYRGERPGGCTGSLGFLPDMVDHVGEPCPVHETDRRRLA